MKKLFLMLLMSVGAFMSAQTEHKAEFVKAVDQLNTAKDFQQLSMIEKDIFKETSSTGSWESYYYSGLLSLKKAEALLNEGKRESVDVYLGISLKFLLVLESKEKNNVEVNALLGVVNHLKSMYRTENIEYYKKEAKKYFSRANGLDSKNERVKLLGQLLNNNVVKYNNTGDKLVHKSLVPVWNAEFLGNLIKKTNYLVM